MAKKGQVQLQQEVNSDEDWEKLLQKDGLIVVDIYSEWCGNCSAMLANLKKLKLEVGGDTLQLAVAKADNISYLERFRNKSEPTWMFLSKGKMVNLTFGANAPKLMSLIIQEIKKEKDGTRAKETWDVFELAPEERIRYEAAKAIQDEAIRIETEKKEKNLLDRRTAVANVVLDNVHNNGVIIIFPQAKDLYKVTLSDLWEPAGLAIGITEKPHFTEAMIEELLYFSKTIFTEVDVINLTSEATFAFYIKSTEGEDFTGDIDEQILKFIYGESGCPPGSPESPAQLLMGHVPVPKEVKESVMAMEAVKESLLEENLAIPSMLSLSALNAESSKNIGSKPEVRSDLEMYSKTIIRSKAALGSKELIFSKTSFKDGAMVVEEQQEEFLDVSGIWAPPNAFTKATAIKLLFPKIYDPIALPEPVPTPPHIAMAYDAFKRGEVIDLMKEYPDEVLRFGFFSDDNPETATLIAKTLPKFDKHRATAETTGDKMVIQLSRKRSEACCAFSQLNPTFMSHNTVDGEEHCKLFFPEGYDEPEEEIEEVVEVKKKKKKGKKGKAAAAEGAATAEEQEHEQAAEEEEHADAEGEGEGEGDGEGEGEETETPLDFMPSEFDKATSPMPDDAA